LRIIGRRDSFIDFSNLCVKPHRCYDLDPGYRRTCSCCGFRFYFFTSDEFSYSEDGASAHDLWQGHDVRGRVSTLSFRDTSFISRRICQAGSW
jgi:hypothetical protein